MWPIPEKKVVAIVSRLQTRRIRKKRGGAGGDGICSSGDRTCTGGGGSCWQLKWG